MQPSYALRARLCQGNSAKCMRPLAVLGCGGRRGGWDEAGKGAHASSWAAADERDGGDASDALYAEGEVHRLLAHSRRAAAEMEQYGQVRETPGAGGRAGNELEAEEEQGGGRSDNLHLCVRPLAQCKTRKRCGAASHSGDHLMVKRQILPSCRTCCRKRRRFRARCARWSGSARACCATWRCNRRWRPSTPSAARCRCGARPLLLVLKHVRVM